MAIELTINAARVRNQSDLVRQLIAAGIPIVRHWEVQEQDLVALFRPYIKSGRLITETINFYTIKYTWINDDDTKRA